MLNDSVARAVTLIPIVAFPNRTAQWPMAAQRLPRECLLLQ